MIAETLSLPRQPWPYKTKEIDIGLGYDYRRPLSRAVAATWLPNGLRRLHKLVHLTQLFL